MNSLLNRYAKKLYHEIKEAAVENGLYIIITKTKASFMSSSKNNTDQSYMWYKTSA
jgi:hypothetical protein